LADFSGLPWEWVFSRAPQTGPQPPSFDFFFFRSFGQSLQGGLFLQHFLLIAAHP
jgi:hypothetical protein